MKTSTSDVILERMMTLHPKVIDLTLDRVWRLLDLLGSPEQHLPPVIHIAGTNGKGSTLAMIRAGLEGAGHRVHAYTSPHLERFHERIYLAGALITEEALTSVLDECYTRNGPSPITYFEITTCAALLAMTREQADYTLLEVGLGGRLDATNVVETPALTVITPVSIDHEQFLGNTLEKIAAEKAGIIKKQVPVIVGPQEDAALDVIEDRATRLNAPIFAYGQHWHVYLERDRLVFQDENGLLDLPLPNLLGAHQIQNAGMALAALRYLKANDTGLEAAVTTAQWSARLQKLTKGPLVDLAGTEAELWLDGGHNAAAGQAIAEHLKSLTGRPTFLVCGMLNTKAIDNYLSPFTGHVEELLGVTIPDEVNTLSGEDTAEAARRVGIPAASANSVQSAIGEIATKSPHARIILCGSLYLAGHILRENNP